MMSLHQLPFSYVVGVLTAQGSICEISPAGVGKLEVVGKVRESMEFSSVFKVRDLSSRG